jgi:hypothetical protein
VRQLVGYGGSKSVTVSTGSSRQAGGASNQELSTSSIVRAASTNGDGLRASPVSLPTTSPGGNDEDNSSAAWTARSGLPEVALGRRKSSTSAGSSRVAGSSRERRRGAPRSSRERRRGAPRKIKSMGTREDTLERSAVEEMSAVEEERSSRREQERPVQSRRRAALG